MSGRFGFGLKAVVLGALVAGSMLGATIGSAAAHGDDRWDGRPDRQWQGRGWDGPGRPDWRGRDWHGPRHHRHWREREIIYAPRPVIVAPPPPRVIYAPPPVIYAPAPGIGFSVNIR